jgi:hypothetical protein
MPRPRQPGRASQESDAPAPPGERSSWMDRRDDRPTGPGPHRCRSGRPRLDPLRAASPRRAPRPCRHELGHQPGRRFEMRLDEPRQLFDGSAAVLYREDGAATDRTHELVQIGGDRRQSIGRTRQGCDRMLGIDDQGRRRAIDQGGNVGSVRGSQRTSARDHSLDVAAVHPGRELRLVIRPDPGPPARFINV